MRYFWGWCSVGALQVDAHQEVRGFGGVQREGDAGLNDAQALVEQGVAPLGGEDVDVATQKIQGDHPVGNMARPGGVGLKAKRHQGKGAPFKEGDLAMAVGGGGRLYVQRV